MRLGLSCSGRSAGLEKKRLLAVEVSVHLKLQQIKRVGNLGKVIHKEFACAPSVPSSYCLCFWLVVPSNPTDAAGVGLSKWFSCPGRCRKNC